MIDHFSSYNPIVSILYFMLVTGLSMFVTHPACLFISLACAVAYMTSLKSVKTIKKNVAFMLPLILLTAVVNPLFNHEGATIIAYLHDGNPLTLESIVFGAASALTMAALVVWFGCLNEVMTSDKIIYLFGRAVPAFSLILSISLRLVPRFTKQIKNVTDAQKCVGRFASGGSLIQRLKDGTRVLSIVVTWALENSIDTSDSMKCRGHGLRGRTSYSLYHFGRRDWLALIYILSIGSYFIAGIATWSVYFTYFPTIAGAPATPYAVSLYVAYALLCSTPLIINVWENRKWSVIRSKI